MKDPELEAFCDRVESEFFRWKGRPGSLSPPDFARARRWFEEGIPLRAVLEGIENAFRSQAAGRERDVEEVNSLAYCEPFVERAVADRPPST